MPNIDGNTPIGVQHLQETISFLLIRTVQIRLNTVQDRLIVQSRGKRESPYLTIYLQSHIALHWLENVTTWPLFQSQPSCLTNSLTSTRHGPQVSSPPTSYALSLITLLLLSDLTLGVSNRSDTRPMTNEFSEGW